MLPCVHGSGPEEKECKKCTKEIEQLTKKHKKENAKHG